MWETTTVLYKWKFIEGTRENSGKLKNKTTENWHLWLRISLGEKSNKYNNTWLTLLYNTYKK